MTRKGARKRPGVVFRRVALTKNESESQGHEQESEGWALVDNILRGLTAGVRVVPVKASCGRTQQDPGRSRPRRTLVTFFVPWIDQGSAEGIRKKSSS